MSKKGEFVHTNLNENQEKPLCFIDLLRGPGRTHSLPEQVHNGDGLLLRSVLEGQERISAEVLQRHQERIQPAGMGPEPGKCLRRRRPAHEVLEERQCHEPLDDEVRTGAQGGQDGNHRMRLHRIRWRVRRLQLQRRRSAQGRCRDQQIQISRSAAVMKTDK